MIYPSDGTFWVTHPFCLLNGAGASSWVTDEELEAAQIFVDWITADDQLEKLLQYGIRPSSSSGIDDITCCNSSITNDNGADPDQSKEDVELLSYPTDDVTSYSIDSWHTIKKPAFWALVIDTSGSMDAKDDNQYKKTAIIHII